VTGGEIERELQPDHSLSHLNRVRDCNTPNGDVRSEKTLNYWTMVERYPNLKEEVGGSNPSCEISSSCDGKIAR
jgi:hypothetical protein